MTIEIDQNSGFCFGVVYAIEMAEDHLREAGQLYCLGDIVHNNKEVERLEALGLEIINHDDLQNLKDATVLIRAHGEPPSTYRLAMENNLTLIDASCPVVLKLQNRVRHAFDQDRQIVILGKKGHAEVNGLVGQTHQEAIVISSVEEAQALEIAGPVSLYSQTTKATKLLYEVKGVMEEKFEDFKFNDTVCRQVSNREPQLQKFADKHDVIVFVSGKKSSNGKALHGTCQRVNPESYFVSDTDEIDLSWFEGKNSVGICGATSTPMWLMEDVAKYIDEQTNRVPA
ncbi:4-hydroxy-3-methylbut-2-enyl diphosphate reductase [Pontibacter sp. G13]|uniref:4-hydroxy-3-methylbut-2-enyl diphosphate reductase n=1 Tax=Pontibacter sp. G13 TaxID=3074898 RepID=UPI0028895067|nr:4-hydroxy-3-methylbut-2-enyl diphosphate reductase [Pontibacter sp. G13]WNJ21538.1 4-hydroxy-3-methylbut-2-enyl diphosphate reductase [Pontibacter sp. G13]